MRVLPCRGMWRLTGYKHGDVRKVITMRTPQKWIGMIVMLAALLLASAGPGHAWRGGHEGGRHGGGGHGGGWHRGHGFHGWGGPRIAIGIGPLWAPYWRPYAYAYPPVVVAPPPVYVQPRQQLSIEAFPAESYWYYCHNPTGYYPYVQQCPGGWQAVAPTPQ
jgi:hypothetical protein